MLVNSDRACGMTGGCASISASAVYLGRSAFTHWVSSLIPNAAVVALCFVRSVGLVHPAAMNLIPALVVLLLVRVPCLVPVFAVVALCDRGAVAFAMAVFFLFGDFFASANTESDGKCSPSPWTDTCNVSSLVTIEVTRCTLSTSSGCPLWEVSHALVGHTKSSLSIGKGNWDGSPATTTNQSSICFAIAIEVGSYKFGTWCCGPGCKVCDSVVGHRKLTITSAKCYRKCSPSPRTHT